MKKRKEHPKLPFALLEVGQSFFVPGGKCDTGSGQQNSVRRRLGRTFAARMRDENGTHGVRFWRTS